jgi:hypothetical protein
MPIVRLKHVIPLLEWQKTAHTLDQEVIEMNRRAY